MKILVNASAMDARGAFSVMNSFLNEMNMNYENFKRSGIRMHFLAANEKLCKYSNDLLNVEFVTIAKKSWYHKWKYERLILPKLFNDGKYDVYLSLQNYVLKNIHKKQFALMHQPIPFSDLKFKDLELINWLKYIVIYKHLLKKQKNYINGVIVQTEWMKRSLINNYQYTCPIRVIRPSVEDIVNNNKPLPPETTELFNTENNNILYPTNAEKYKNNKRLIEAVNTYNIENSKKVRLFLTIDGNSTDNIKFIGKIPYESILTLYKSVDALIFPSLTETLGLPLLEAQMNNIPVIAADLPYAREICGDNCSYFDPRNVGSIKDAISEFTSGKHILKYEINTTNDSYFDYIKFIMESVQ